MTKRIIYIIICFLPLNSFAQNAGESYKKGEMYYYGKNGITKDYDEAAKWYQKAAEQGHISAQFWLGVMYENGQGVTKDYTEALKWYKKAAEQGFDMAQWKLGHIYMFGRGVVKDNTKALIWHLKAAEQGDQMFQYQMGLMYEKGSDDVAQDYNEAAKWYRKAAEQGHPHAQNKLGHLYKNGYGVTKDYNEALKWYKKAADSGNTHAMRNIGILYENGWGVTKNYETAREWYQKSINNDPNYTNAQTSLANIEKKIANVDEDIPLGSKNENLFAVIIGNEKYENEQDVPFAESDANIFREYCRKTLGVDSEHLLYFTNAGYNNINIAIHWLKARMEAYNGEASAIFYYAGHGIPDESSKEGYLLPVDGMGSILESAYSLKKLSNELAKMPAHFVIVFLDACFSGANRDGQQMASTRGIALKIKETQPQGKVVFFSAAQGDQTASPYIEQNHGLYTYFLLRKLKETKGDVTLGELSDYLTVQVKRVSVDVNDRLQTPTTQASDLLSNTWQNMKLR